MLTALFFIPLIGALSLLFVNKNHSFFTRPSLLMQPGSLSLLKTNIFYYFLLFSNSKIIKLFSFFIFYLMLNLFFSVNIVYCMDDINDNVSSPDSPTESFLKKRKFGGNDSLIFGSSSSSNIIDSNIVDTNVDSNNLNNSLALSESGLQVNPSATVNFPPSNIIINLDNAFKYIGVGLGIGSATLGGAKIIKALLPSARAPTLLGIVAMATAYKTTIDTLEIVLNPGDSTSTHEKSKSGDSIISKKIPLPTEDLRINSTLEYGDTSINVNLENDTLTLSDLKRGGTIPNTSTSTITDNLNIADNDYYKITDSYNINSLLENGDLITIFNNNPYLKLEAILFFTLCIMLYSLFAITTINILSKFGETFNNYFTNKYILMYINLNRKYFNILIIIWTVLLLLGILLCLVISYVLIITYENYCIQSPNIVNSFLLLSLSRQLYTVDEVQSCLSSENKNKKLKIK